MTRAAFIPAFLFLSHLFYGQKYNFVNLTVEDGLIQSQASFICQDRYRQLWIGTEGGISRFDGKKFIGYTVQEGLVANHISAIQPVSDGALWIGTNEGVSVFNGKTFTRPNAPIAAANIREISQADDGTVFVVSNLNLVSYKGLKGSTSFICGDSSEKVTALYRSPEGHVLATVHKKGLYVYSDKTWNLINPLLSTGAILRVYITSLNDTLLVTRNSLLKLRNNSVSVFPENNESLNGVSVLCIAEDHKQNIWLGTDNGAVKLHGNTVTRFNEKNGFTNNSVNHIYKDIENNLWFATNADGIFKFNENTFTYYDKSSGLSSPIVMGITQTPDSTIYAGGLGGGLFSIGKDNQVATVTLNNVPVLSDARINSLYADNNNNVWAGTLNRGVFCYNPGKGIRKTEIDGATAFIRDVKGNLLVGNGRGLFIVDENFKVKEIKFPSLLVTSLKQLDKTRIIAGTSKGLYIIDSSYTVSRYLEKEFADASVLCLAFNVNGIWAGTTDRGVYFYHFKTGKVLNYNTNDRLPSNFIYSIDISENNIAWIGTGFGISNVQFDSDGNLAAIKNYGRSDGLLGMECNHNSLLKAADSSLWFGTTKGLFHFNPNTSLVEKNQPFVLLRSVKLFSSDINDSAYYSSLGSWFNVPAGLNLPSRQNHLTFELGAIYFTNPDDVLYRYRLVGVDKGFTTTNNPYIIYPSLPPGTYTLNIRGVTRSGVLSSNEINYFFTIEKAFYQTRIFQFLVILLFIGSGAVTAFVLTRQRQKRKQREKEILARIREEEFMKLRQRTAEDFHDEMGNSLTRISVLTDVLKSKLNGTEPGISAIVGQIKENTTALYSGSRDIIWSLNAENDGLYEISEHIRDIANELFRDSGIDFSYSHNIPPHNDLKLKLDFSRNLTMIFKEAFSNIIKHSKASAVLVKINLNEGRVLSANIYDNGCGYKPDPGKHGNGVRNMQNRVTRMGGLFTISSDNGKGTVIYIELNNIFTDEYGKQQQNARHNY